MKAGAAAVGAAAAAAEPLSLATISPRVRSASYAVRGPLLLRAEQIQREMQQQAHVPAGGAAPVEKQPRRFPFSSLVFCNIGNPMALAQRPLTFGRQLLCALLAPPVAPGAPAPAMGAWGPLPADVLARAEEIRSSVLPNVNITGAYSHSQGLPAIRRHVAQFIERRDGIPSDPDSIFLANGASPAIQDVMRLLIRDARDGIMVPIPQYPLYSASISVLGGAQVPFYLDEDAAWGGDEAELDRAWARATAEGVTPRALVVINPGNPTGQILSRENMEMIARWAERRNIVLVADEVYQENVYADGKLWHSFKSVCHSLGVKTPLVSFHSVSKGFTGECGHRGGYMEVCNFPPDVLAELYKLASILLCPNTAGQVMVEAMVNPPREGEPSYALWRSEVEAILGSLKRRAHKLIAALNELEGVSSNPADGAMYAFPRIRLPQRAVQAAADTGARPDDFYCLQLLENTGVCVVPGSGFGQVDGTYHFRTTFLPPEDQMDEVIARVAKFHKDFMARYA